jgi:phospholipid transport system substrate-binding protein
MKTKLASYLFIFTFFSCVTLIGSAFASQDPTEQLRPALTKITGILANDTVRENGKIHKVDRIMDVVKENFDFMEMSKRVLGKKWRSLSNPEKKKFVDLFTQLLKHAYITKMDKYSTKQRVEYIKQRIKGNRAEVQTLLVDGNWEIPISYIMLLKGEQWLVYDVVVEGVSLVRNYHEQFRSIMRKSDFNGLTHKIEMKIVEFQQKAIAG